MSNGRLMVGFLLAGAVGVGVVPLLTKQKAQQASASPEVLVAAANASTQKSDGKPAAESSSDVIGSADGVEVTRGGLKAEEKTKLFDAENSTYRAAEEILMQRYLDKFFEDYRKKHNLPDTMSAQREYLASKVKVSDKEVNAFLEENKDNPGLKAIPEKERAPQVRQYLEGKARSGVLREMVDEARESGKIKVAMPRPVEPRLEVSDAGRPSIGSKDAKVTLIEFADTSCPYCARMVPTLQDLMKKYDGKVRWVYRHFPLREIHPHAMGGAIAMNCAGEQGQFWEMHNLLFKNSSKLNDDVFPQLAKELKMDVPKFEKCLKDPKTTEAVLADIDAGSKLGVNGTPSYFVNGRRVSAGDERDFERVINEELKM